MPGKLRDWAGGLHDRLPSLGAFRFTPKRVIAGPAGLKGHDASANVQPAASSAPVAPRARSLHEAIHWTVLYSGIFDYPLTLDEVHRYLMAPGGSRAEVEVAVGEVLARGHLETDGLFLYPPGRAGSVATRLRRGHHARHAWRRAHFYARLIWVLPYVRLVAVTGALAMDNVEEADDIDFLIVTEPGRLWLTRGMVLILARLARLRGDTLCPNFIISTGALLLEQRDLYTAHELAQMTPLHGGQVAERLRTENTWCRDYLPNIWWRDDEGTDDSLPRALMAAKALARVVLDLPLGELIERWEQKRKIAMLLRDTPAHGRETLYTADVCKGHADGHGSRVMERWTAEIEAVSHAAQTWIELPLSRTLISGKGDSATG